MSDNSVALSPQLARSLAAPPDVLLLFRLHYRVLQVFLDEGALTAVEAPFGGRAERNRIYHPFYVHILVTDEAARLRVAAGLRELLAEAEAERVIFELAARGWELTFTDALRRHYQPLFRSTTSVFAGYALAAWATLILAGTVLPLPFLAQALIAFLLGGAGLLVRRGRRRTQRQQRLARRQQAVEDTRFADPELAAATVLLWRDRDAGDAATTAAAGGENS